MVKSIAPSGSTTADLLFGLAAGVTPLPSGQNSQGSFSQSVNPATPSAGQKAKSVKPPKQTGPGEGNLSLYNAHTHAMRPLFYKHILTRVVTSISQKNTKTNISYFMRHALNPFLGGTTRVPQKITLSINHPRTDYAKRGPQTKWKAQGKSFLYDKMEGFSGGKCFLVINSVA